MTFSAVGSDKEHCPSESFSVPRGLFKAVRGLALCRGVSTCSSRGRALSLLAVHWPPDGRRAPRRVGRTDGRRWRATGLAAETSAWSAAARPPRTRRRGKKRTAPSIRGRRRRGQTGTERNGAQYGVRNAWLLLRAATGGESKRGMEGGRFDLLPPPSLLLSLSDYRNIEGTERKETGNYDHDDKIVSDSDREGERDRGNKGRRIDDSQRCTYFDGENSLQPLSLPEPK